jgi:integrase
MAPSIKTNVYRRQFGDSGESWMVRWKDPVTSRWRSRTGGRTRDEAVIVETQVRTALLMGKEPFADEHRASRVRLSEILDRFYRSSAFLSASPAWQATLRSRIEGPVRSQLGTREVALLSAPTIYDFYFQLKESQGYSNNTIRQYHLLLCLVGDVFTAENPGQKNPFRALDDFSKRFKRQAPTRDINFLTEEELKALFKAAAQSRSQRLLPFAVFQATTGLRRSEALRLKWRDIDWSSGFLHVRQSKNGKARMVPLEEETRKLLRALPRRAETVFATESGEPCDPDSFLKPLKLAAKAAGIEKRIDVHTLRHSYGSNKLRAGWGLKKVSVLLGHSDITITAKVYTHLLDGDLKVRDEVLFDNPPSLENSERSKGFENRMTAAISQLVEVFSRDTAEALSDEAIQRAVEQVLQTATAGDNGRQPATRNAPAPRFATQVLHSPSDPQKQESPGLSTEADFLNLFKSLPSFKMADPPGLEPGTFRSVV